MNEIEILQHKISINWFIDEDAPIELDESDTEHITKMIIDGFNEGELNHGNEEVRGYWKIVKGWPCVINK
jgi:hypothetical protein